MAPTNLEKAEADREALKDHLEFLESELQRHNATPLLQAEVDMYLNELDETRKLLGPNHSQIRHAAPKATDMGPYVTEYRRLSQMASRVYAGLHGVKMTFPPPASSSSHSSCSSSSHSSCSSASIKLPPLELPKFSGNLQEWVPFRDLFITAVHNSKLTKVEKLTQLKGLLTGEAARQIRSLILSDANYDIAWTSLQERYENSRELLFSILRRLLTQSVISSGTAASVRSLIDTTKECVRSLEVLAMPTQHLDAILLFLLFSKLDQTSRELWEQSLPDTKVPDLSKMYEFLEQRARALAASNTQHPPRQQGKPPSAQVRVHHAATSATLPCKLGCSEPHPLWHCDQFQQQNPSQRAETVKRLKVCVNCLSTNHSPCPSKFSCRICKRRHHTMTHGGHHATSQQQQRNQQQQVTPAQQPPTSHFVHVQQQPAPAVQDSSSHLTATQQPILHTQQQSTHQPAVNNHHITGEDEFTTGVLATARIRVTTHLGDYTHRALVDGGANISNITESAARSMKLKLYRRDIGMKGLQNASLGTAKYITRFTFKPYFDSPVIISTTALVVDCVSGNIPAENLQQEQWSHLQGLQFADPDFHLSAPVEILLGTEVFWGILEDGKIKGLEGQPHAVNSSLGWLVGGPNFQLGSPTTFITSASLDLQIQRFWEQENLPEEPQLSTEEAECESHFLANYKRDACGRFTVSLPFKRSTAVLGESRYLAVRRFLMMERRFNSPRVQELETLRKLNDQWQEYKLFMSEYEQLGHMSLVPPEEVGKCIPTYYIPHHSVIKESSTTTKLRVVFDASAVTSTGVSLNQCLMVGPQLQDNIWDIMLRFRLHSIAFTADIAKMYRQIRVTPRDAEFQRIIWREDPSLPFRDYRLNTVTYGTAPAPFLAIKCLQQLALEERERFPLASKIALKDFYVDDTASGCSTLDEAKETVTQLQNLCMSGGFELRKWTTNSPELLATIPEHLRETKQLIEFQEESTVKTLGVYWNAATDSYSFRLTMPPDMPGKQTKRSILSDIAKIYDPLGWLAPAVVSCKIFMQDLWKVKLNWDDALPPQLQQQWSSLRESLADIDKIQIPRCVIPGFPTGLILLGCSDASIKAISATIYILCEYDYSPHQCHLLTSKTRVAPLKHVTLPRLELNGALLLAELMQSTVKTLQLNFKEIRAFTDSTITFHWVTSAPSRWKPYVRRRVQAIQDAVPAARWYHIPGDKNPADCASRGITAADLLIHPQWWNGHPFMFHPPTHVPDVLSDETTAMEAEAQASNHHATPQPLPELFRRYSSFNKLQRVIAYVLRFINNWCRRRRHSPQFQATAELLSYGVRIFQSSNSILNLQPFIGDDGLIRVGGRLRQAAISFARKHPILLPRGTLITTTIITDIHLRNLHSGPSTTLSILQQRYWVTNGRDTVRAVTRKCVTCTRHQAHLMSQMMGDLPPHRINPSRPFSKVGVDYAGPINLRPMVRSRVSIKCWIAIFVCLSTRAIHIEVVSSLSTECFLAALRRFISRRGKPTDIFSDCGTNFKGADKVLRDFFVLSRQQEIQDECSSRRISWHFSPSGAPHFNGLWEAGVKSIKHHLHRVMGSAHLTYEEMLTLVIQIEGILNSRPLVPASSDPSDLTALTPGHFLIGAPITAFPEPDLTDKKENYLQRWNLLQQRQQLFWKRWSNEYISRLQQRPKWMKATPNLQVGSMVIIKDERLPPLKWKLGRVVAVHPGADGHVRVATLKTSDGEIKRPVVKLCLLPIPA